MTNEKQLENKIVENLAFDKYLENKSVSQSSLKNLSKCPRYYQYVKNHPVDTDSLKFGRMLHSYVLEPDEFIKEFYKTKKIRRVGKAWEEVIEAAEGKEIVFEGDIERLAEIKEALLKNDYFSTVLKESVKESSIFWQDNDTKINCKGRLDGYYKENEIIFDLKSTRSCFKKDFFRSFWSFKYHIQAAFYLDGVKAATGKMPKYFVFFAIEKEPPFLNANYLIRSDSEVIEAGRNEYKELLNVYQACLKKNNFDIGLDNEIILIDHLPDWYNF